MVDPITASMVVSLISPFLVKVGEKFAEKAGEKLADKTGQIYKLLKESFAGDEYAGLTLLRLEQAPENEERKSALETVIKEKMEDNYEFAERLTTLINEAKKTDINNVIASGDRSVAIGGNVHSSNIITGDDNKVGKE